MSKVSLHKIINVLELCDLLEFKPPSYMLQGNVGTPTKQFFELVRSCKLGASIIKKLGLSFEHKYNVAKYGAVPYIYDGICPTDFEYTCVSRFEDPRCIGGARLLNDDDYEEYLLINEAVGTADESTQAPQTELIKSTTYDNNHENDDELEEWDRFEALHDDPYHMNRANKANIKYENKVELVWEKGGSGLVFHTDQRTWDKLDPLRKEEPFDEPASFDWDIDMEPYENLVVLNNGPTANSRWSSARDTCDLIDINRSRLALDVSSNDWHNSQHEFRLGIEKGYGFKLLEQMGWKPGTYIGQRECTKQDSRRGLLYPLTSEGSLEPHVRTGLGYCGEKVWNKEKLPSSSFKQVKRFNPSQTVYIRSVFDDPQVVSKRSRLLGLTSSLLRREDPSLIVKWSADVDNKTSVSEASKLSNQSELLSNCHHRTIILNAHSHVSKMGISFIFGGYLNPPKPTITQWIE